MAKILILHPNRVDKAVLSGGSWLPALPLANLQNRVLKRVARSVDVQPASTQFIVKLDQTRTISALVLIGHNLTLSAQVRWTASTTADFANPIYDSSFIDVYPPIFATEDLEWEDDNWWSGKPTSEDLEGFTQSAVLVLPQMQFARYWKCELQDPTNPSGYVQVGRVFMSSGYQPTYNYSYGGSLAYETDTQIEKSLGGTEYFDPREPYRVMKFGFEYLPEAEVFSRALEIQRRAGVHNEVFVVPDPDDTINMTRRAFLGRLRTLNALEQVIFDRAGIQFEVKELL